MKWAVLWGLLFLLQVAGGWADGFPQDLQLDPRDFKEGECDLKRAEAQAIEVNGWTTLTLAVLQGDIPKTKALLDAGTDANTVDKHRRSLLMLAGLSGLDEMMRFLLERGADINAEDENHRSLLMQACLYDLDDLARFLIERGADVNRSVRVKKDKGGDDLSSQSPLSVVLDQGDLAMADLLFKKGANLDCGYSDATGPQTPLFQAISRGESKTVRFLLDHGAAPKGVQDGIVILRLAFEHGDLDVVRFLFEKSEADWKQLESRLSLPPLHLAAQLAKVNLVEYFLSKGVPANQLDSDDQTVLTRAAAYEMNQKDFNNNPEDRTAVIRLLAQNGANIAAADPPNRFLLADAISTSNSSLVRFLMEQKYNPMEKIQTRDEGTTLPLSYAIIKGHVGCVRALIEKGADPLGKQNKNQVLLDLVRKHRNSEVIAYFEKLFQTHVDFRKPGNESRKSVSKVPIKREDVFTSKNFNKDSTGANTIDIAQFKVEKEVVYENRKKDNTDIESGENYYFLRLKDVSTPLFLSQTMWISGGAPQEPYFDVGSVTLEWLKKGELFEVSWKSGSGKQHWTEIRLVLIEGTRLRTIGKTDYPLFGRGGPSDFYRGEQKWEEDRENGDILWTRIETKTQAFKYIETPLLIRTEEGNPFVVNSTRTVYRFRLEGKRLRCVSAKEFCLLGNELPLLNIAMQYGISLQKLYELNPDQKGRIFCNGTVFVGDADLLSIPEPKDASVVDE